MAALSEQIAQETWELMFRMLGISTGLVADVIAAGGETVELSHKALEALTDKIRNRNKESFLNDDGTVALQGLMKKIEKDRATLLSLPVADEDVSLIKKNFKKQGITFATCDVGFDDIQLFMFADTDSRKAELAVMQSQSERGLISDLNPDLFFNNTENKDVGTISGLDNVELELFRYHAKQNGLIFTSVVDNGSNTIVYDLDYDLKAKKTISDVVWDGIGPGGELIRTQIEHKISNRQAVNIAFLDGEREHYIVNGDYPDNYIHITANDFEYYKHSKKIFDVSRSSVGFMDRAIQAVNEYDNPVLIHGDVFERSSAEDIKKQIESASNQAYNNEVLQEAISKQLAKRIRIEEKMGLDDENQEAFWLFDDSVTYSQGAGYESVNDMDDEQRELIASSRLSAKKFKFGEFKSNDKSLERLIFAAESQKNRGYRYIEEPDRSL